MMTTETIPANRYNYIYNTAHTRAAITRVNCINTIVSRTTILCDSPDVGLARGHAARYVTRGKPIAGVAHVLVHSKRFPSHSKACDRAHFHTGDVQYIYT